MPKNVGRGVKQEGFVMCTCRKKSLEIAGQRLIPQRTQKSPWPHPSSGNHRDTEMCETGTPWG